MSTFPADDKALREARLQDLCRALGYRFKDQSLLDRALRHSSYCHEFPEVGPSNEQLEFLGDAVLALLVSHLLVAAFPESTEGELSRRRAALVNARQLAELARGLNLGSYFLLGRGEERQAGREKPSLLADALEAVLAAVYLDGGFTAARRLVRRWFAPLLLPEQPFAPRDFKTALQEYTQARCQQSPTYHLLEESGPGHARHFHIEVRLGDIPLAQGEGPNKKQAAQQAAQQALAKLWEEEEERGEGG